MAAWLGKQAQVCVSRRRIHSLSSCTLALGNSLVRYRTPRARLVLSPWLTEPQTSLRTTLMWCFNGCLRCLRWACQVPVLRMLCMLAFLHNIHMTSQVASALPSAMRDDPGWMDLLPFVTPSSAAAGPLPKPELDSLAMNMFLDAYQVSGGTFHKTPHFLTEPTCFAGIQPHLCFTATVSHGTVSHEPMRVLAEMDHDKRSGAQHTAGMHAVQSCSSKAMYSAACQQ